MMTIDGAETFYVCVLTKTVAWHMVTADKGYISFSMPAQRLGSSCMARMDTQTIQSQSPGNVPGHLQAYIMEAWPSQSNQKQCSGGKSKNHEKI